MCTTAISPGGLSGAWGTGLYGQENDTGPDDANHSQYGIFIMRNGRGHYGVRREGSALYDVAPTILELYNGLGFSDQ